MEEALAGPYVEPRCWGGGWSKHGGWALQTKDAKIWPVLGDRVVGREERQARQRDQQKPEHRGVK